MPPAVAPSALPPPSCPLACARPGGVVLGTRDGYHIARCPGCDHLFVVERPGDEVLARVYDAYSYQENHLETVSQVIHDRLAEIVAGFARYRALNRLLDVGFGAGAMLLAGQRQAWEVHGVERSALAVSQARSNGFVHALQGDFLEVPYPPGSFDVLVMTELIEHLPDPLPFLQQAARLLRGGGLLFMTTPNGAGISARVLAAEWSVVAPPEHLHLFSPRSMTHALARCGFADVDIRTEAVNPIELVTGVRRKLRPGAAGASAAATSPTSPAPSGHSSIALNERMSRNRAARLAKSLANAVLRASHLGDSLKIRAVRQADQR